MTLIILIFTLFTQQQEKITKVEFTSLTRGYQESVTFTPDSVTGSKPEPGDRTKIKTFSQSMKKQEWKHLTGLVTAIPRSEFESLTSPTNKRTFDGARHSTITVTLENGETYNHLFDDENPHEKLQPLMKCISKIRAHALR